MRSYLVFVVALLTLLLHKQSLIAQIVPPPQNNSVKLRLEIELRGVLSVTEKSATLTNKETIWEWVEVPEYRDPTGYHAPTPGGMTLKSREVDKVWELELDENLKKVAKTLHGKEIEVTGKCLLLGVKSSADTARTPAVVRPLEPAKPGRVTPPAASEGIATTVLSQLLLDSKVTVSSLKAAK